MKRKVYIIRCLGFGNTLLFLLSLPVRFLFRFKDSIFKYKSEIRSHLKIRDLIITGKFHTLQKLPGAIRSEINQFYKNYNLTENQLWHRFFITINSIESPCYISEGAFYNSIEPRLNNAWMVTAYTDKNIYERILPSVKQPQTILRYIDGRYYDSLYTELTGYEALELLQAENSTLIFKPSIVSGRGRNIFRLIPDNGRILLNGKDTSLNDLTGICPDGFIIQKFLDQHPAISAIYPHSLNTVRIVTLRYRDSVEILSAIFKMGNEDHFLDKMAFGGLSCGINKDGTLFDYAFDNGFSKHKVHPQTGTVFKGLLLPGFQKLEETVINAHKNMPYFDMISWDMAIDPEGEPVMIEMNLRSQGIIYQQAIYGPLFGDKTREILNELIKN